MDHWDDQHVIAAILGGDVNAYGTLVRRYQKPIFNLMYRMTGSHADALDLSQETFIKAYDKLRLFKKDRKFFPWLYTIGLNHVRNFIRDSKSNPLSFSGDFEEDARAYIAYDMKDPLHAQIEVHHLDKALQTLPTEYREAVLLHYHEEFSMEEIAEMLQLSVSGAKMRVHRGLKKLRETILGKNDER
jgi:RNA polymerase sigma-70 factor (ECF subfamily)